MNRELVKPQFALFGAFSLVCLLALVVGQDVMYGAPAVGVVTASSLFIYGVLNLAAGVVVYDQTRKPLLMFSFGVGAIAAMSIELQVSDVYVTIEPVLAATVAVGLCFFGYLRGVDKWLLSSASLATETDE